MNNISFFLFGQYPDGPVGGLAINIIVAVVTFVIGFILAIGLTSARLSGNRILRFAAAGYVNVIRSTPLLMLVFWFYFLMPVFFNLQLDVIWSAVIALSIYASAYLCEILRAGVLSVHKTQHEAALSTGLTNIQSLSHIVFPQAFKKMIPCLFSFLISLFKDTSVLYIVGVVDLMQVGVIAAERQPDHILQAYLVIAMGFFTVCYGLSLLSRHFERTYGMLHCHACVPEDEQNEELDKLQGEIGNPVAVRST
jgi:polar amino acid transport system permease protein